MFPLFCATFVYTPAVNIVVNTSSVFKVPCQGWVFRLDVALGLWIMLIRTWQYSRAFLRSRVATSFMWNLLHSVSLKNEVNVSAVPFKIQLTDWISSRWSPERGDPLAWEFGRGWQRFVGKKRACDEIAIQSLWLGRIFWHDLRQKWVMRCGPWIVRSLSFSTCKRISYMWLENTRSCGTRRQ
jgi:hypothetical protein